MTQTLGPPPHPYQSSFCAPLTFLAWQVVQLDKPTMTKEQVRARIEEIGVIPAVRLSSSAEALFAAEAVCSAGIPIVEVTMTVPGAIDVIAHLVNSNHNLIVGAGTAFDMETARRCLGAGVKFLTSTGLDLDIVELAHKENVLVFPGVLTPSEVHAAAKAGCQLVKVFPCCQVGGPGYIRVLKAPFPDVSMIASGGVTQQNVAEFIRAGAVAIGVGQDLIPRKAIDLRESDWIRELARRFVTIVKDARAHMI
jgi:2-dehydro-3-deoxyphosphogluconate aldolase/(4S)-4-hydroxy-2-oxoglutarate aldolase